MSATLETTDVLATIAGIEPGSPLAALRAKRPEIVRATQESYLAIFEPEDDSQLSRSEREAIAVWVATLSKAPSVAEWHRERLLLSGPAGQRLSAVGASLEELDLSSRERALLRHAELLTLRPATAQGADIRVLEAAGVSSAGIVTLAQLVAFLSFEIRTIATLRAIAEGAAS
jgi:CMD domain protein